MLPASCVLSMHACTCSTCSSSSYATPFGKTNKKKKRPVCTKILFKKNQILYGFTIKKKFLLLRETSLLVCVLVLQACRALLLLLPSFQGSMLCPQLFCCSTSNFPPFPQTHPPPSTNQSQNPPKKGTPGRPPPPKKKTPKQNLNNSQGISKLTKDKSFPLPHRILTFPSYLRNKTQPHP